MAAPQPADRVDKLGRRNPGFPVHGVRDAIAQGRVQPRKHPCKKCGQKHLRCSGHHRIKDESGELVGLEPCGKWPMHGQSVCGTHGGKGRNREVAARQWAKERQAEEEKERLERRMERAVKTFGLPVSVMPQQALMDEIARTAGHVQWLGEQVGDLDPTDLDWGKGSEEHKEGVGETGDAVDLTTTTKVARPAVIVQLYQAERAHLVHVCKVAIQCGIAERQVRLAEEQGRQIATALKLAFEDPELQLTAIQLQIARNVASKALRSLSIGGAVAPSPMMKTARALPEKTD